MNLTDGDVLPPSDDERRHLTEEGYVVIADVLDRDALSGLRERFDALIRLEGTDAGHEFRHLVLPGDRAEADYLGNLLAKDDMFRSCLVAPRVLGIVRHLLGNDVTVHAMNARNPRSHGGEQVLHAHPGLVNTLWLLDEMTADNGPTRVLPGSHRLAGGGDADGKATHRDERLITAPAGAVIVLSEQVLHGGTVNQSGEPRRIVTTAFSRPDVPPQYP